MFAGKNVICLFGQSASWLRQLELQVFTDVSSTDNHDLRFVNVSDSQDSGGPMCRIQIRASDAHMPSTRAITTVQGFVTEQDLRGMIDNICTR